MSFLKEYIDARLSRAEYMDELQRLISEYNKIRNTYLFVYAAAIEKPIAGTEIAQSDLYVIRDFLSNIKNQSNFDMYIETPGGSGETSEDIVRYLRQKFQNISFVVSGEAKSAGTIIVLSGDEILLTETGSLGPIDAQITVGRSVQSAYDYWEWVEEKRIEANKDQNLNPFDATIIAQITPGEMRNVFHALNFAKDLVVRWLVTHKFKNWEVTEQRKIKVSSEMKEERAREIADILCNHGRWRTHGRSIKINDLEEIGLQITRVDDTPQLADIVYRIQTVCRLIFDSSSVFKIFATADNAISKQAVAARGAALPECADDDDVATGFVAKCPKCTKMHKVYAKFEENVDLEKEMADDGYFPFPKEAKIVCSCNYEIDLLGIKIEIENNIGKEIIYEKGEDGNGEYHGEKDNG